MYTQMLPHGPIIILDTETGGVNARRNPLLSIGLVHATEEKLGDAISIRFKPPEDTWIEVPILADQVKGKYSKEIEFWLNLSTGETQKPGEEKPAKLIAAVAAEVNGFVKMSETKPGWDMLSMGAWGTDDYATGAVKLAEWIKSHPSNATLGHNVNFDNMFIEAWLPELLPVLPLEWACTQQVYKKAYLNNATKGSSVEAICKVAGYNPPEGALHTEIGDCNATFHIWKWLRSRGH